MKTAVLLKANDIKELKLLGSYFDVKKHLENELGIKLGSKGWSSLFDIINVLKKQASSNKSYLLSICDEHSFKAIHNFSPVWFLHVSISIMQRTCQLPIHL